MNKGIQCKNLMCSARALWALVCVCVHSSSFFSYILPWLTLRFFFSFLMRCYCCNFALVYFHTLSFAHRILNDFDCAVHIESYSACIMYVMLHTERWKNLFASSFIFYLFVYYLHWLKLKEKTEEMKTKQKRDLDKMIWRKIQTKNMH